MRTTTRLVAAAPAPPTTPTPTTACQWQWLPWSININVKRACSTQTQTMPFNSLDVCRRQLIFAWIHLYYFQSTQTFARGHTHTDNAMAHFCSAWCIYNVYYSGAFIVCQWSNENEICNFHLDFRIRMRYELDASPSISDKYFLKTLHTCTFWTKVRRLL